MSKDLKNLEHAEAAPIEELENLKDFWSKYGSRICLVLLAFVALFFGVSWYNQKQEQERISELIAFNQDFKFDFGVVEKKVGELEILASTDETSNINAIAMAYLGAAYNNSGRYAEAIEIYENFLTKYEDHELVAHVTYSLAVAYENQNDFEKAISYFTTLEGFDVFKQDAQLGNIRCLILCGKKDEAKNSLDVFIADNAGQISVNRAETLLNAMDRLKNPDKEDLSEFFSTPTLEDSADALENSPAEAGITETLVPVVEAPAPEAPVAK